MGLVNILSIVLGILGLVASILGAGLAFFTFINPKIRMDWYLNHPQGWEKIHLGLRGGRSLWRYKKHPEFIIERQDEIKAWDYSVTERWMKYPLPDPSKTSYLIHVSAGNIVVYSEEFVTLDGGRYLVPLPRVKYHENKEENEYFYEPLQIKIARVIGEYYRFKSIDEFIEQNEIEVRTNA
ncbi:MAG: hypothetical protein AAB774_01945 [Patescibacteria group bacterium]